MQYTKPDPVSVLKSAKLDASDSDIWRKKAWIAIKLSLSWYFLLGLAIAMLTPEQILRGSSLVHFVSNTIALIVPAMPKFIAISTFPEVTALYLAAMWIILPIPVFLVIQACANPHSSISRPRAAFLF